MYQPFCGMVELYHGLYYVSIFGKKELIITELVITEKPSVAISLAAVLGADQKKEGYLEGGGYIVSWCVGHLLELAQPGVYDPEYVKWRREHLPILPQQWKYEVPKDKKKQLTLLCRLMKESRVDAIVCATDAGREGELIFRLVYNYAECTKPIQRLWISSMEDDAIREGFAHLRPGSDYDRLYDAALCRAGADWIVGINATRLYTILYGTTLNVGRVMSPTLALLVQREAQICAFKSTPFYVPEISCGSFTASGEKLAVKADAEKIRITCDGKTASVQSVEKQIKTEKPPRLYDLTTLQRECNRIYDFTAQQTLDYLQSLYEKKLATYPRTDSQYLTEDMRDTAESLIQWIQGNLPFGKAATGEPDIARVTNNKKVTDHHAIIPTLEISRVDFSSLPKGERAVLELIAARLLSATSQPHQYEAVKAVLFCGGYEFTAKGKTVLEEGWKAVDRQFKAAGEQEEKDAALPELRQGQIFESVQASIREGKTSPPKHYTEDTLLATMETAGAEDMPEDAENGVPAQAQQSGLRGEKEGQRNGADARHQAGVAEWSLSRRGLGTPATRAATLEKLVKQGFVERKKKQLLPTQKGTNLITVLPEIIKSPILTAQWESKLKQVEHGEMEASDFMEEIKDMTRKLICDHDSPEEQFKALFAEDNPHAAVGVCPRCGGGVYEGKKGFFCENKDCAFALWKDNRFWASKRKTITRPVATALLKEGRVFVSGLYSEKTGKPYNATVILDDTGDKYVNFKLDFSEKKGKWK